MERGTVQSTRDLMKTTLSSGGYSLTAKERQQVGCDDCGNPNGLDGRATAHQCCWCADGGRVRAASGYIPCPSCSGRAANPDIQENPTARMRLPLRYAETTFGTWLPSNGSPRVRCMSYVSEWPPSKPHLLLTGNKGTGKTTLSIAILKAAYEKHRIAGQFWPVTDLLARLRATADPDRAVESEGEVLDQMVRVPLLVLDDWGAHKATDFAEDRLFTIIDQRYRDMRPTVVTTNTDLVDLDSRVKSRLADSAVAQIVQFTGKDMRPEANG